MKRIALKLVACFEVLFGLAGLVLLLGALLGKLSNEIVPLLWFGLFPLMSLAAGLFLWLGWKPGVKLSAIVLLLQVPFIYTQGLMLNLGFPFNFTIKGVWLESDGRSATVLGINFLALGVLVVLLWSRSALQDTKSTRPHLTTASS